MTTTFEAGDKVFVVSEKHLATVLDVFGDGINGDLGDIRLDWSGVTALIDIEMYDAQRHVEYDHTFLPIFRAYKAEYGITKDVPLRD